MNKILLLISITLVNFNCSSVSNKSQKDLPEFELVWEGENLLRVERFKNTGNLRAKGPVRAECSGKPCTKEQVALFAPPKIKSLPKQGSWEEFLQLNDADLSTPDNQVFKSVLDQYGEYVDGKKQGIWKKPDPQNKSTTLATTPWLDGKREGVAQSFGSDGQILSETEYKSDKKNGPYWRKNSKGEWVERGTYIEDEEDGIWNVHYMGNTGNGIKTTVSYKLGKKQGLETNYYFDGKIESQGNYTADARTGSWKLYYDTGSIYAEGMYSAKEGSGDSKYERTGVWKEYFRDGKLFGTGPRKHTRTGSWKFYYKNGQIACDAIMANESQLDSARIWNQSGVPTGEGKLQFSMIKINEESDDLYLNFRPSIPFIYFHPEGGRRLVITSEENATEYDEGGKALGTGPVTAQGKKNGCWTYKGSKLFFMNDNPNPKFTENQCK